MWVSWRVITCYNWFGTVLDYRSTFEWKLSSTGTHLCKQSVPTYAIAWADLIYSSTYFLSIFLSYIIESRQYHGSNKENFKIFPSLNAPTHSYIPTKLTRTLIFLFFQANFLFLVNIIRILVYKLRTNSTLEVNHSRSVLADCMYLFGV